MLATVSRLGPLGGRRNLLEGERALDQVIPTRPAALPSSKETELTQTFSCLVAECIKPKLLKWQGNDWISDKTWALAGQWTALRLVGKLSCAERRRTKCLTWASLHNDRAARTKGVGDTIKVELAKGDMQEVFHLLKGWY